MRASEKGHVEVVHVLLGHNAQVNLQNNVSEHKRCAPSQWSRQLGSGYTVLSFVLMKLLLTVMYVARKFSADVGIARRPCCGGRNVAEAPCVY